MRIRVRAAYRLHAYALVVRLVHQQEKERPFLRRYVWVEMKHLQFWVAAAL